METDIGSSLLTLELNVEAMDINGCESSARQKISHMRHYFFSLVLVFVFNTT